MSLREDARPVLAGWRTAVVDLVIGAAAAEVAFQVRFNLRGATHWDLGPRARLAWVVVAALAVALSHFLRSVRARTASGETLARPTLGVDSDAALAWAGFATLAAVAAMYSLGVVPDAIAVAILAVTTWLLLLIAERLRPRLRPWRDEVVLGIPWSALALWWLWLRPSAWERSFGLVQRDEPLVVADSYLLAWILAWGRHALGTHPWRLFEAPIFFPVGSTLALSDHLLGILPLFARGEGPGWVGWMLAGLALVPPWRGRRSAIAVGLALVAMGVLVGVGPGGLPKALESLSPYRLLVATLPGFSTVRLPYRMIVVAQLGVALLAALGFDRIGRGVSPRLRPALAAVAIAAMLATQWSRPALSIEPETLWRDVSPAIR